MILCPAARPSPAERFALAYADERGEQRVRLTEACSVPFEHCVPARGFPYKGQRHHVGRRWTATTGSVGYESWPDRHRLVLLDFDPEVVGIASQPFWLVWATEEVRSHAPDYIARLAEGSALLMAAADFVVLEGISLAVMEPFGLLEFLPAEVVAEAERRRDHLVEIETGLCPALRRAQPHALARTGEGGKTCAAAAGRHAKHALSTPTRG
ncbi:hypothetical protein [Saccharothrix espanaensis]|uniref:hypothetical protein n=1 Tax=Saccharothrix espanaensis TaxID=103731 RepID=UPI0011DC9EBA|nr:hypothetical protein [Saccharothrix espanaensis]